MSELSDHFYEISIPFLAEQSRSTVHDILERIIYDGANEGEYKPEMDDKAFQIIDSIENFNALDEKLEETIEVISVFFFEDNFEEKFNSAEEILKENKIQFKKYKKPVEDWNEEWKKHYKPIDLKEGYKIIPSHLSEGTTHKEVYITPGQGFGTGEHSTTYLCLKHFIDHMGELKDKRCLDFGCGSGILGIAAIKWAGMNTDFMDIDPRALDNCVQNLVLNFKDNDLEGTKVVSRDRFQISHAYELVFANILEHVLMSEKENIDECVVSGGLLVLSGILIEQIPNIQSIYEEIDYQLIGQETRDEWAALVMKKK